MIPCLTYVSISVKPASFIQLPLGILQHFVRYRFEEEKWKQLFAFMLDYRNALLDDNFKIPHVKRCLASLVSFPLLNYSKAKS